MKDIRIRPFTKAVFEKEGKGLVGSPWTQEQVQQAYEKADDLLDVLAKARADEYTKRIGLERGIGYLAVRMVAGELREHPDKSEQQLIIGVLSHLLERGLDVAATAANAYENMPDLFKIRYATSAPAFMKDKFFQRKFPVSSFEAFRTQENPAICENYKFSEKYAAIYSDLDHLSPGIMLMCGDIGRSGDGAAVKLFRETRWIQAQMNRKDFLAEPTNRTDVKAVVAARMGAARE